MIISKTPLRISFVGGGSDIIRKQQKKPGSVISTTINKYIYVFVNQKNDKQIRISYSKTENVKNTNEIKHPIIKACLNFFKIRNSIEIITVADIPSKGSGLGSSSTLTVGVLNALKEYTGRHISKYDLAKIAYQIESSVLKKTLGYQDHFNAAYGGFNCFKFYKNHKIEKKNLNLSKKKILNFKKYLILFNTEKYRLADKILKKIPKEKNNNYLDQLSSFTNTFYKYLAVEDYKKIGEIIDRNWNIKKKLDKSVTNNLINKIYDTAKKNGAMTGKILGAGGGGYFLVFAHPKFRIKIIQALKKYQQVDFNFTKEGSKIIYNDTKKK
ncbi:hypothetical protein OAR93_00665 [Pelagibacteraceae bacterium]|nr:hypothetical protein [Pelagibacteraceae bacterium]